MVLNTGLNKAIKLYKIKKRPNQDSSNWLKRSPIGLKRKATNRIKYGLHDPPIVMTESQMTEAQNQAQSGADVTRRWRCWYVRRGTGV